jgi:hypothetical protein
VIVAFLKDLSWTVVVLFSLIFAACCFLAVLWSKREWQSRKIRVGMFLEREYNNPEEMEAGVPPPTPPPPPADEAPTKGDGDAW